MASTGGMFPDCEKLEIEFNRKMPKTFGEAYRGQGISAEKPWAVSWNLPGSYRLGKVVKKETGFLWIKNWYDEIPERLRPEETRTFDDPLKAMGYFLFVTQGNHNPKLYTKKDLIQLFAMKFPEEKSHLEMLLAQRQPKFTRDYIENHCCPH
jgi:hypothetical protein